MPIIETTAELVARTYAEMEARLEVVRDRLNRPLTYGEKILDGFDGLPQHLQDYVMEHAPEYSHAPDYDTSPNTTSWRYFKQLIDSGEYDSSCQ